MQAGGELPRYPPLGHVPRIRLLGGSGFRVHGDAPPTALPLVAAFRYGATRLLDRSRGPDPLVAVCTVALAVTARSTLRIPAAMVPEGG
jgi:hypothetical protein